MEKFLVYVNERTHAERQVLPMLEQGVRAEWTLVACPPPLSKRAGRWLSTHAKQVWREDWARQTLAPLVEAIERHGDRVKWRVAQGSLVHMTQAIQMEQGAVRIIDARQNQAGQYLPRVSLRQPQAEQNPFALPAGAVALGTMAVLVAD